MSVSRRPTDAEAVLRLAAGSWAHGEREDALRLLLRAAADAPESTVFLAAAGVAAEGLGRYDLARANYLAFVQRTASSDVTDSMAVRIDATRMESARGVVDELRARGSSLYLDVDPSVVALVVPFTAPDDDRELRQLAAVATELTVVGLRQLPTLVVVDWELSSAAHQVLQGGQPVSETTNGILDLLGGSRLLRGEFTRGVQGEVRVELEATRIIAPGRYAIDGEEVGTSIETFPNIVDGLIRLSWELLQGVTPGTLPPTEADPAARSPDARVILGLGEALLRWTEGDRRSALDHLEQLAPDAGSYPPFVARLAQVRGLETVRGAETLPLAESLLGFARRHGSAQALQRRVGRAAAGPSLSGRSGIPEVFGLDRLGTQVFADFILRVNGGVP